MMGTVEKTILGLWAFTLFALFMIGVRLAVSSRDPGSIVPAHNYAAESNWVAPTTGGDPSAYRKPDQCFGPNCPY